MNEILSQSIRSLSRRIPFIDFCAVQIVNYLPYALFAVIIVIFIIGVCKKDADTRFNAVNTAIFVAFALLVAAIVSAVFYFPRPFVKYKFTPLTPHINDSSFPSDHATESMSIALGFYSYNKVISVILLILSVILGFVKVYVGHHSVLDVLLSYLMTFILYLIYTKLLKNTVKKLYYKVDGILFKNR